MATQSIRHTTALFAAARTSNPSQTICRSFSATPQLPAQKPASYYNKEEKKAKAQARLKKRKNPFYKLHNLKEMEQFSLCDAMRYIKAIEAGRRTDVIKYEAHVKLKTSKTGPMLRQNTLILPHPVKTEIKFAMICPPDSRAYKEAKDAGAALVGEEEIFERLKTEKFDQILAHPQSLVKIKQSGLPRILGPKGMMPNTKNGTVTSTPAALMRRQAGGALYRERAGVVRLCIGTLAFTPNMLRRNLAAFVDRIKEDASKLGENDIKEVNEVVLSSTNGPGMSLNGTFFTENSVTPEALTVP